MGRKREGKICIFGVGTKKKEKEGKKLYFGSGNGKDEMSFPSVGRKWEGNIEFF